MKKLFKLGLLFIGFAGFAGLQMVESKILVFSNEQAQTADSGEFVIDVQNYEDDIDLKFGESIDARIRFNRVADKFEINRVLHLENDVVLDGSLLDEHGDVGTMGQVLTSTVTGTDWITNFSNPIPSVIDSTKLISPSTNNIFLLEGENFLPTTTVSIPGFDGTINAVNIFSSKLLELDITAGPTETTYDIVVSNGGVLNTEWVGNGVDFLKVESSWLDLRSGGANFTSGGIGSDIRYRSGMSMFRGTDGMYFTGANPWSSWVKFESLGWTRGQNKTLEWIFTSPSSSMMIGVGSDATNEFNNAQYQQAEVQAYFSSSTNFWGLYGNNGNLGSAGNQSNIVSISSGSVYKIKFTNDGGVGSQFTLYELPSANQADWDDESNIITNFVVGGTLNPDEINIMPFIIPRSDSQRFIAVKVE